MPNLTVDPQIDPLISNDHISVNPFPHNLSKSILIGILIFVLLSLTAYGAYWYGQSVMTAKVPTSTSTPGVNSGEPQKTLTPAATDETVNWKVYEYKELGISFKYPDTWYLLPTDGTSGPGVRIQSFDPATAPGRGYISSTDKGMSRIIIDKWSDNEQVTSLEALKTFLAKDNGAQGYLNGDPVGKVVVSNEKDLSFKEFKAFYRETSNSTTPNDKGAYTYFFNTNGQVIEVFLGLDVASARSVYNQILPTFKFLDSPAAEVVVESPLPKSFVTSPLLIKGKIIGGWMLEGSFPIVLLDENRKEIVGSLGKEVNKGSWTSGGMIEFRSQISFSKRSGSGYLVLRKSNPSGLAENDKVFEIPLNFLSK